MEKAVVYSRVSDENREKDKMSPEIQVKICCDKIKQEGWHLAEKPYIDDGRTGTNMNRPGLISLLARCSKKDIRYVLVQDTSRLSRETIDYLTLKRQLKSYGTQIVSTNQPMAKENDAWSQTIDEIIAVTNALHPRITGMKVRIIINEKFYAGWWPGWAPLGYENVENPNPTSSRIDKKIVVPDKIAGLLIKEVFEIFSTGAYSISELVDLMYEKGLASRTGKKLSISSMQQILTNPFYHGLMRLKDKETGKFREKIGKHDPLVTTELFDKVQYVLAKHRQFLIRKRKHSYLLRGFVICPIHNRRFTAETHNINSKRLNNKIHYYHCPQKGGCKPSYIEVEKLEAIVANLFKKLEFKEEFINLVQQKVKEYFESGQKDKDSQKQALINKRIGIEKQIKTLNKKLVTNVVNDETFKEISKDLRSEFEDVKNQIENVEVKENLDVDFLAEVLALTRNIHKTYLNAPDFLKRHYLRFFFESIYVQDEKVVKVIENPIFSVLKKEQQVLIRHNWLPRQDSNL